MNSHDTCSLCCEVYGKKLRPRVLSCGHNYCTECLQKMIINKKTLSCPTCLKIHHVSSASEVAVNFALEETLSKFAELEHSMRTTQKTRAKRREMDNLIAEQKSSVRKQQILTADMKKELFEYDQYLCESKRKYEEFANNLFTLATRYKYKVREMNEERMKVVQALKEAVTYNQELNNNVQSLDTSGVEKVMECVEQLKEWIEKCQQQFPDPKVVPMNEEQATVSSFLDDMERIENERVSYLSSSDGLATLLEKVSFISNGNMIFDNVAVKLRQRQWMQRIASGKVVAIDSRDGIQRCGNLSLKEDRIYLHCLRKRDHTSSALKVKHSDLIASLNRDVTLAFMDLWWDGSIQGRIHILLSPDTPLARNFRILCTGELGLTYANTDFFHCTSDSSNRYIMGGNYELNTGGEGKVVVEGINFNESVYKRNRETGQVYAYGISDHSASQFSIITNSDGRGTSNYVFGKLQDGIELVREAYARIEDKKTVVITDCGIVLPL